jgi:ribonuclease HI
MAEIVITPTEGVLYTDGSCNAMNPGDPASRGWGGWGMHGYFYSTEKPKVGAGAKKGVPSKTGYDIKATGKGEITVTHYVDAFASVHGEATNNQAELMGALEALRLADHKELKKLLVRSDSRYVVDIVTGIAKYRQNGFHKADGTDMPNRAIWMQVSDALQKLEDKGVKATFVWVKAHNGKEADPGNVLADRYARRGTLCNREGKPIHEVEVSEAKGYWKAEREHHRMLSHPHLYFTTTGEVVNRSPTGHYIYRIGDIRTGEEFLGKKLPDASFAVVYLKEPEDILEMLHGCFTELARGTVQGLMTASLANIFTAHIYQSIMKYGDRLLIFNRQRQAIEHMDKARDEDKDGMLIGHEIRPTRMAYDAIQLLNNMEALLDAFLKDKTFAGSNLRATRITDLIYERTESPKKVTVKLKPTIPVGLKFLDVDVEYKTVGDEGAFKSVRLTLGQDLPDRNTLGALAEDGVEVYVVTWPESAAAFRYAVIIQSGEDVGVWAGPYANLQLVM